MPRPTADRLDGLRLAVGTFTILRVRPPGEISRRTAGQSMLWAPAVGAVIGLAGAAVLELTRHLTRHSGGGTLLAATLTVTALAVLTRGLHLDGLADTADGLGCGKPAAGALEVMRRSDIGPFGVVTLVLTLMVQVLAIDTSVARGTGGLCVVVAAVTGRLAAAWGCARGVPAARPDGLGAAVAGSLRRLTLLLLTFGVLAGVAGLSLLDDDHRLALSVRSVAAVLVALAAAGLLLRRCVGRFGGVTGDVLGALVEVATAVSLCCFATL
jgi:adenosylcobinamide-GDP ribazoletransferase